MSLIWSPRKIASRKTRCAWEPFPIGKSEIKFLAKSNILILWYSIAYTCLTKRIQRSIESVSLLFYKNNTLRLRKLTTKKLHLPEKQFFLKSGHRRVGIRKAHLILSDGLIDITSWQTDGLPSFNGNSVGKHLN